MSVANTEVIVEELIAATDGTIAFGLLQRHPRLLSAGVLARAQARFGPHPAIAAATRMREGVLEKPWTYPLGAGPIELIHEQLTRGEIDLAGALSRARSAEVADELSLPYVRTWSRYTGSRAVRGEHQAVVRTQRVVVEATHATDSADELLPMRWEAMDSLLQIGAYALHEIADPDLLSSMVARAESLLAGPEPAPDARGHMLFMLGIVHLDPWVAERNAQRYANEIADWVRQGHLRAGLDQRSDSTMPEPSEALRRSEQYLRSARTLLRGHALGRCLKALVQLLQAREILLHESVDPAEMLSLAREGYDALEGCDDPQPRAALRGYLAERGVEVADEPALDWRSEAIPRRRRAELALTEVEILLRNQPGKALELALACRDLFDDVNETLRVKRWSLTLQAIVLVARPSSAEVSERPGDRFAAQAPELDERARDLLAIAIALQAQHSNHESEALTLLRTHQFGPGTVTSLDDVLAFLAVVMFRGMAVNAINAGDESAALLAYGDTVARAAELGLAETCVDMLARIADIVAGSSDPMVGATLAVVLHRSWAVVDALVGEPARVTLRELTLQASAALTEHVTPDAIGLLMQLSSGLRFAAACAGQASYRVDEHAAGLLARIAEVESEGPRGNLGAALPDEFLLAAYGRPAEKSSGVARDARLSNLRHAFDQHVQAALARQAGPPSLLTREQLRALLPPRTALLELMFGRDDGGDVALFISLLDGEDQAMHRIGLGFPSSLVQIEAGGVRAYQHPLGLVVAGLREALIEPPNRGPAVPEAIKALETHTRMLVGALDWLARSRGRGNDRLVIVPSGPLRFVPFHALGPVESPLGEDWAISYLPNVQCLARGPAPRRSHTLTCLGLDYVDAPTAQILVAARKEAEGVAAAFGVTAAINGAATRAAFVEGLRSSRYVHFSGHGKMDPGAPAFQSLALAPAPDQGDDGTLYSYELLAEDLTGLELVSLSACESGLGRYDLSDNIAGIPASVLIRGARAIAATLWSVRPAPARHFFTELYTLLAADRDLVDAFATAQRSTRAAHPEYRDWAAFFLTGV